MRKYCAIPTGDKYSVATIGPYDCTRLGDVRKFDTFDEANQVAKDISNGKYGYPKGMFVNMR